VGVFAGGGRCWIRTNEACATVLQTAATPSAAPSLTCGNAITFIHHNEGHVRARRAHLDPHRRQPPRHPAGLSTKPPATPWKTESSASDSASPTATTGPSAKSWPAGYRSQSEAEFGFRQLKDPHVVSFSPLHHHTDAQIRVHVFCCVLALTIAHLMRRQAAHAGMQMSVRAMLDALAGIQQAVLLYPGDRSRPKARHMITDMDDTQQKLFEIFELHRWAPA
jgi:hypothetical protein